MRKISSSSKHVHLFLAALTGVTLVSSASAESVCESRYAAAVASARSQLSAAQNRSLAVVRPFGLTRWASASFGERSNEFSDARFVSGAFLTPVAPVLDLGGVVVNAVVRIPKQLSKRNRVSRAQENFLDHELVYGMISEAETGVSGDYLEAIRLRNFPSVNVEDFINAVRVGASGPFCRKLADNGELKVMSSDEVVAWLISNIQTSDGANPVVSASMQSKELDTPALEIQAGESELAGSSEGN